MKGKTSLLALLFALGNICAMIALYCLTGCNQNEKPVTPQGGGESSQEEQTLKLLSKYLNIPEGACEASWAFYNAPASENPKDEPRVIVPGPKDWGMIVLISFQPEEFAKLLEHCPKNEGGGTMVLAENLLNEKLITALSSIVSYDEEKGVYVVNSPEAYKPVPFYKSPLLTGVLIPLRNSNQVFIRVQTT